MSLHQHHIPENDTEWEWEEVIGYCEGCEKSDVVLVDDFAEYCGPCLEANEEYEALAFYSDRVNQRAENGWRDA